MLPGGLRVQLLVGLTVLLLGSSALAALLVENVMTRRLLESRREYVVAVASAASTMSTETLRATVDAGVVHALVVGEIAIGPPVLLKNLRKSSTPLFVVNGSRYLRVEREGVLVATGVDDVGADVKEARGVFAVFGILVAILAFAFGYGFFSFVVIRPIRAIGVATERAGQGDLASPITVVPHNEIGRVAGSFNEMLRRLEQNKEELESKLAELEQTNAELQSTRDSLVRSEKLASVGQLAAGIAHEIGNPLAALSGYNELLHDGGLDDSDVDDLLRRSGQQLDRIRGVIRNLLDFSRDESGGRPGRTSLAQCVDETISLVRAGSRSKAIEFVALDLDAWVEVVPSQLVQVLVNLAMNAADALGDEGGRVEFTQERDEHLVRLVVQDDGPGVPADLRSRVFDPFFTTKDVGEGTGLGLAVSARIIESFGGELLLEPSTVGARFVLSLRLAEAV